MSLRAFKVDEANWYAGNTAEEARAAYREDLGPDADEYMVDFGESQQLSDDELDRLKIVAVDEPGQPSKTFREALAELDKPGFIASTWL